MRDNIIFDKNRLQYLLHTFLQEIDAAGVVGTVHLVGGAALSLYYFEGMPRGISMQDFPKIPELQQ